MSTRNLNPPYQPCAGGRSFGLITDALAALGERFNSNLCSNARKTCNVRTTSRSRHGAGSQLRSLLTGLRYILGAAGGNSRPTLKGVEGRRYTLSKCVVGCRQRAFSLARSVGSQQHSLVVVLLASNSYRALTCLIAAGIRCILTPSRPLPFSLRTLGLFGFLSPVVEREETVGLTICNHMLRAFVRLTGPLLGLHLMEAKALFNEINLLRGVAALRINKGLPT